MLALAGGATVQDAATATGVSERTIHRWLKDDPDFKRRVGEARAQLVERTLGLLSETSAKAATVLGQLLEAESETVRLGACRAILELRTRLHESVSIEERVALLEAQLAAENRT